jgi:hypothetical protein
MPYVLHSKNALDPAAVNFNPESVFAWNVQIDESLAEASKWEEVTEEDLENVLKAAPGIG